MPPLALTPDQAQTPPFGNVQFSASGGTGAYVFALRSDGSGASLNETTGAYLSGAAAGTEDEIAVTDLGCEGQAVATVQVRSSLEVIPAEVETVPAVSFRFDISGGSGNYLCAFEGKHPSATGSGGQVSPDCEYQAGAADGVDIVRVNDVDTGGFALATIQVSADARLRVAGHGRLFLLEGEPFVATTYGGSGHIDPVVMSGPLSAQAQTLMPTAAGEGMIRFTDRYTAMTAEVPVTVLSAFAPDVARDGERSGAGFVHASGDLNGDGYADGVLGFTELSVGAHYSGAVAVYAGGPDGLKPSPVQVFAGTSRIETYGRDVELADVSGDGEIDLLIGADRSDQGKVNSGGVFIHYGIAGDFFSQEPSRILRGENAGDRFGHSVVTCDFDGDGNLDLAVGALEGQNDNVAVPATDQGAVHVFRGDGSNFPDKADFILYGQLPAGSGDSASWQSVAGLEFGTLVRAGDIDGDGLCDLVVGSQVADLGDSEDGVVLVYRGTTDNNLTLTRTPVRVYAPDMAGGDGDGNFANAVAVDDIDGDGKDDIAIGHYRSSVIDSRAGAVYVFRGGPLPDADGSASAAPLGPDDATWVLRGTTSYEYMGASVALSDWDGDAYADLVIGASRNEDYGSRNSGTILVFTGADIGAQVAAASTHDAGDDSPSFAAAGAKSQGRLGQAVDVVGRGALLALAGYDDTYGTEAGAPYYVSSAAGAQPRLLDMPGESAGHEFGQGLTLFDVDGDGDRDLVIGGPGAADSDIGANSGMVYSYHRQGDDWATTPEPIVNDYPDYDGSDRYGYVVTSAGDFDGDGFADLAVVARGDSRPSSFDANYANPDECPGSISNSGAVYIFRGSASGIADAPSFVAYGPDSSGNIRVARGDFDYDGDGRDDLLIGSFTWGNDGGFAILRGRDRDPGGVVVLCEQERYFGVERDSRLGSSLAALGDLDGDGCDEVAVGAPREDLGIEDQGVLRVLWGWGGIGCPASPQVTTMILTMPYSHLGTAVAGGGDIDGDGIFDLAVGGANFRYDFSSVGAAWMVSGAYLLTLPRDSTTPGNLPIVAATDVPTLLPELGDHGRYGILGPVAASLFGDSIALIPDPEAPARAAVAVGVPRGNLGQSSLAGGVAVYRYVDQAQGGLPGLDPIPYAVVSGETSSTESMLGQVLEGHTIDGKSVLLVGAPQSDNRGLDFGAGFVLRF